MKAPNEAYLGIEATASGENGTGRRGAPNAASVGTRSVGQSLVRRDTSTNVRRGSRGCWGSSRVFRLLETRAISFVGSLSIQEGVALSESMANGNFCLHGDNRKTLGD